MTLNPRSTSPGPPKRCILSVSSCLLRKTRRDSLEQFFNRLIINLTSVAENAYPLRTGSMHFSPFFPALGVAKERGASSAPPRETSPSQTLSRVEPKLLNLHATSSTLNTKPSIAAPSTLQPHPYAIKFEPKPEPSLLRRVLWRELGNVKTTLHDALFWKQV